MDAFGESASLHEPSSKFIDNEHAPIFHDVMDITLIIRTSSQSGIGKALVDPLVDGIKIFDSKSLFNFLDTRLSERAGAHLLVDVESSFSLSVPMIWAKR